MFGHRSNYGYILVNFHSSAVQWDQTSTRQCITHCVLLEHYYSMDFPWQFDRKMTKPLITWWLEKKVVKWQKFKSALCNLTQKLLLLNFVSMQFWTEISNQSGSQIHARILLKQNSKIIIYSIFAGQVLFTVNGLNWSQSWQVLICLLRKSLNHWNTN